VCLARARRPHEQEARLADNPLLEELVDVVLGGPARDGELQPLTRLGARDVEFDSRQWR